MSTSNPSFNPSCPSGGSWYACGNGVKFTGCCRSNPCNNNGCPQGNLMPASFDATKYGQFPDQQCSAGLWYTCATISPPFLGCCKSNPCRPGGCPTNDLTAAFLSNNNAAALAFDPEPPLSSSTSSFSSSSTRTQSSSSTTRTQSSSSSTTRTQSSSSTLTQSSSSSTRTSSTVSTSTTARVSSSTTTSAAASTATPVDIGASKSSTNIPAIAGGAAGGVVVLLIILFAFWRWHKHMKRSRQEQHNSFIRRSTGDTTERVGPVSAYAKHSDDKSASATLMGYTPDMYQDPGSPPPPFRSTPTTPHLSHFSDPSQVPMIHEAASREVYRSYSPSTVHSGLTSPTTVPYRSVNSWIPTQEMYAGPDSWPAGGVHHVRDSGYGNASELDSGSRRG